MTRLSRLPIKISAGLGLSMIDRAVKESFAARCKTADLAKLHAYFGVDGDPRCFYCGAPEPSRWDHLHAVTRGGDTVPGNLVPACGRCDDSKQDRTIEEWVGSKSPHRPAVSALSDLSARVSAYQREFAYVSVEFEKRLSPDQLDSYRRFRLEIDALRRHLEREGLLKAAPKKGSNS
jgi:hypothetical protein